MNLLAFLMLGPEERGPLDVLASQLPYAGTALIVMGFFWVIGRAVVFRKGKKGSFYPYAAILLGIFACGLGFALEVM